MGNSRAAPLPEPGQCGRARAGPGRRQRPRQVPRRSSDFRGRALQPGLSAEGRGWCGCGRSYFREGPFCILKRGLGFSLASAGDPGATAAPGGLVQAWAPPPAPAQGRRPPSPRASGPERPALPPTWAPDAGSGGAWPGHCTVPLLKRPKSSPWAWKGLWALLPVGLLVMCSLGWTLGLRTLLMTSGAVSLHQRRDPSCEAERGHHKRTQADGRASHGAGGGGDAPCSLAPVARAEKETHCPRTQLKLTLSATTRPVFSEVGVLPMVPLHQPRVLPCWAAVLKKIKQALLTSTTPQTASLGPQCRVLALIPAGKSDTRQHHFRSITHQTPHPGRRSLGGEAGASEILPKVQHQSQLCPQGQGCDSSRI